MPNLIGHAHQTGTIVFERRDNPWAFRRLDTELKTGQENRIKFDPAIAPVVIEPASTTDPSTVPWIETFQSVLQTASYVYLHRTEDLLRFRQSVHHLAENKTLIALGSLPEVHHFADENWSRISHIYAQRHSGFRFDIERAVSHDKDKTASGRDFERMEIQARIAVNPADDSMHLTFDATGSNAHVELIAWRNTVDDGAVGRFAPPSFRLALEIATFPRPFIFCDEYHPEFKSHWYLFAPKVVQQWIQRLQRKKTPA